MEALAGLIQAWLDRDDVPSICPQSASSDTTLPGEVQAAGSLIAHILGDGPAPTPFQVGESLAASLTGAIKQIALETSRADNAALLRTAASAVAEANNAAGVAEAVWSALCPNAAGLRSDWNGRIGELRARRALADVRPATDPIRPGELLITANVLLAPPLGDARDLPEPERSAAAAARFEEPLAFYDHPIPIDVDPDRHELLRGLTALDRAVAVERERGVVTSTVPVVLSISSTHRALELAAAAHVSRVTKHLDTPHLEVFAFTERLVTDLIDRAIAPAIVQLGRSTAGIRRVLGVAGPYGRHYSFLKAISAPWSVLVDTNIRATFKIDLDQTFPQHGLLAETGKSAFEHMCPPHWGGRAVDAAGRDVALEFVAGFLVNEADAVHGLRVPDVQDPGAPDHAEDFIFYPALPQALSTEAEMMPGSKSEVRQRVHITGGTTGATVAGMRRLRPFSPSFWGRAEDQAFALSMEGLELAATLHVPYLVMRHDKDSFAQDAIAAAAVDKLIGDHERILMFSAYGRLIDPTLDAIQARLAPFTGAFVSPMPVTLAYLRLAVTTLSWARAGKPQAARLFRDGVRRLAAAQRFVGPDGEFHASLDADRQGWNDFYDAVDALEAGLAQGAGWAQKARSAACRIVADARIAAD